MKTSSADSLFDTESIWAILLRIAPPVMLAQLIQAMYNIVDSYFVGQYSNDGLTALSIIYPVQLIVTAIAVGTGVGVNTLMSHLDGRGKHHTADRTAGMGTVLALFSWAVFALLSALLMRPFALSSTDTPAVAEYTVPYGMIVCVGSLGVFLESNWSKVHQARGNMRLPMAAQIAGALTNIVLDLLFVAVFHWGVASAALATIISQILSAALAFRKLMSVDTMYKVTLRKVRFDLPMLKQIVTLGIPSGVQNSVISLANVIVQANINAFGSQAMAGCAAYSKVEGFAFLPVTCFSMALATFVSQNVGAGQYDRVRKGMKFGILTSVTLAEVVGVLIFTLSPFLIGLFNDQPNVVVYGVRQAHTAALFYCLLAFSHCCAGILRGLGRPVVPMAIMLAVWCALRICYITVMVRLIPDIGVIFWAYPLTWAVSGVLFAWYLAHAALPSPGGGAPQQKLSGRMH